MTSAAGEAHFAAGEELASGAHEGGVAVKTCLVIHDGAAKNDLSVVEYAIGASGAGLEKRGCSDRGSGNEPPSRADVPLKSWGHLGKPFLVEIYITTIFIFMHIDFKTE